MIYIFTISICIVFLKKSLQVLEGVFTSQEHKIRLAAHASEQKAPVQSEKS